MKRGNEADMADEAYVKVATTLMNFISLALIIIAFLILFLCLMQFLYRKFGNGELSQEEQRQWQQHRDNQEGG